MKREYRIRYIEPVDGVAVSGEEAKLEELGADGWEAVSAWNDNRTIIDGLAGIWVLLKRQKAK